MKSINVVAAVIKKENKIFCCKRGKGKSLEGYFEFPGGKIEPGETQEEALIREIKEELNSLISVDRFIMQVEYDYPSFHLIMDVYYCSLLEGHLQISEHSEKKWCDLEELETLKFAPADCLVVEKICKETK